MATRGPAGRTVAARSEVTVSPDDEAFEAERYYREMLDDQPVLPWANSPWTPVTMGPAWQVDDDGYWALPQYTVGWSALGWMSSRLRLPGHDRIKFTREQASLTLWWYAIDEDGTWLYRDGVLQRVKGWGKDPIVAAWSLLELAGPCRPDHIDKHGTVHTRREANPYVQLAAVSEKHTGTTTTLYPSMITPWLQEEAYIPVIGRTQIIARGGAAELHAVAGNPLALEGFRTTAVYCAETQNWLPNNIGHQMDEVLRRQAIKAPSIDGELQGHARRFAHCNAPEEGQDSISERDRQAAELGMQRLMFDTLEAPEGAPLDEKTGREVIPIVRGDSIWLSVRSFVEALTDDRDPPSQRVRFWYNSTQPLEGKWMDPQAWKDICTDDLLVLPGEEIVIFVDGSKSDDCTGVVGCRIDDGYVFVIGVWAKPAGHRGTWRAPREEVTRVLEDAVDVYEVLGVWGDPSDTMDDNGNAYWPPEMDSWHRRWGSGFTLKASKTPEHSVIWDMRTHVHQRDFTMASMQFVNDVEQASFFVEDDARLKRHVRNARKRENKYGTTLGKEKRGSQKKVDLAVCAVGARMMRRLVMLHPEKYRRKDRRLI